MTSAQLTDAMLLKVLLSPYRSESATFYTPLSVEAAAARLRRSAESSLFRAPKDGAAVGSVTANKVSLQRVVPLTGNSFKPFFVGHFEVAGGRTRLVGKFTIHWVVKFFMLFWYGGCLYWSGSAARMAFEEPGQWGLVPLLGIGMLLAGAAFVAFARWLADGDREYLSGVITGALSGDG